MTRYASGTYAKGVCDICGLTFMLNELSAQVDHGVQTNIKACSDCWSPDHPQNFVGRNVQPDAEVLRDPRPDLNRGDMNVTWGWMPVYGLEADGEVGAVTT